MKRLIGLIAIGIGLIGIVPRTHANPEVVVAIRYLQAKGESHSHLFLFREDGRLLRQLTKENSGQDQDPIFAPDGETIVFTRTTGKNKSEFWSIEPRGAGRKRLESAPEWYSNGTTSPYFEWPNLDADEDHDAPKFGERSPTFRAPDGSVELVLREVKEDEDDSVNQPGHGKHYLLRDLKTGAETEFVKLPGFEGAVDQMRLKGKDDRFLLEPPLRLAFFGVHLNSTDGSTVYALDLTKHRLVRLSSNWATPFPLPGDPAFLTMTYLRYLSLPGTTKTVNCSYLERWDSGLKRIRYAREKAPAICYGASMYRPGKAPAVITIRNGGE